MKTWLLVVIMLLVVLVSLVYPEEPTNTETLFITIIEDASEVHDVDSALIQAMIMAESRFRPRAVSKRGAKGLMQLMPRTAKSLGVKNAFDPKQNIHGGVKYFRQLLDRFQGNIQLALAAYNAGKANVLKHNGIPPFPATKRYIKKVLNYRDYYLKKGGESSG